MLQSWFAPLEDLAVMTDSVSDHLPSPPRRDRSFAGRRKAHAAKGARERRIVNLLNAGVSVAEIAQSEGVTHRRMRMTVGEILARRAPQPPAEFLALQVGRLSEALLFTYRAMSESYLQALHGALPIASEPRPCHRGGGAAR